MEYTEQQKQIYNDVCEKYKHNWLNTTVSQTMAMEMISKALTITDVVQAKPEKVCELIRQKFDDWVFGLETQAGEKLKVVDSTDFNEIITEIENELKDL